MIDEWQQLSATDVPSQAAAGLPWYQGHAVQSFSIGSDNTVQFLDGWNVRSCQDPVEKVIEHGMACKATWDELSGESVRAILLDLFTTEAKKPLADVSAKMAANNYSGYLIAKVQTARTNGQHVKPVAAVFRCNYS